MSTVQKTNDDHQSRYLSAQEAVNKAAEAYNAFFDRPQSRAMRSGVARLYRSHAGSRSIEQDSVLYVVNFDEGGFAVVPADRYDSTNAYAIGENGMFDDSKDPAVQEYMAALHGMAKAGIPNRDSILNKPDPEIHYFLPEGWYLYYRDNNYAIEPVNETETYEKFVLTKWGQGDPYNMYCPLVGKQRTLVGCVAVAIGQMCSYYRVPEKSIDGYELDWDEITRYPHASQLDIKYQQQIAHLLRQIGIRAKLEYGVSGTAGYKSNYLSAIKSLGYKEARFSTNIKDVISNVRNYGPCLVDGRLSTDISNGHLWVIDGIKINTKGEYLHRLSDLNTRIPFLLKKDIYIHCNWGWNGNNDGYYLNAKIDYVDHRESYNGQNIEEIELQEISVSNYSFCNFEYVVDVHQ